MPNDTPFPWLEVIGLAGTFIVALIGQAVGIWKMLMNRFVALDKRLDQRMQKADEKLETSMLKVENRSDELERSIVTLDRDQIAMRGQINALPTKDHIEALFDRTMTKLEARIDQRFEKVDRHMEQLAVTMQRRRSTDSDA